MTDAPHNPLASVIIPTRNRAKYLERSLASVFAAIERYPNTELIVIDGASTDGTVDTLKKYDSKISFWKSEPDSGVAEAVNKGFAKSHGEIILLFGDDDELLPDSIGFMVGYLLDHPEVDAVFGAAENFYEMPGQAPERFDLKVPLGRLTLQRFLRVELDSWPAPEMQFSRRRLYDRWGAFDERYRYGGCLDAWCRQARGGAVLDQIDRIVARRHYTQLSGNVRHRKELAREVTQILWTYGGAPAVLRSASRRLRTATNRLWYRALNLTRPLRHPLRAIRGD